MVGPIGPTGPTGATGATGWAWNPTERDIDSFLVRMLQKLGLEVGDKLIVQAADGRTRYLDITILSEHLCGEIHKE
jgi:hypothetical protein